MSQKNTDDFACPTSVCMPFRHRVKKSDIIVHNSCFILFLKLPWGTQTYLLKGNVTFLAECIWKQKPWLPIHILSEVLWWRPGALWIVSIDNYANPFQNGMMTSSSGKKFPVTGPLCGEFTAQRWIPLTKASDAELRCFFIYAWINGWVNNRCAGYLRRHRAHYDVTVMFISIVPPSWQHQYWLI